LFEEYQSPLVVLATFAIFATIENSILKNWIWQYELVEMVYVEDILLSELAGQ